MLMMMQTFPALPTAFTAYCFSITKSFTLTSLDVTSTAESVVIKAVANCSPSEMTALPSVTVDNAMCLIQMFQERT